ncbi:Pyruvate phosphate dikinase, PEP/pyruvate binding domain [Ectothiorhodospira magna]|uniref:Pyruvate phosphate dikinase, PEP/pyruvate binding domain n=1 Tax=Ectothiorhodospira magna TaxID=867345 RepID=A0A1H9DF17_9GAMM|nr:PEP/pyruvate-binding domain-containing protein [Ectothiorhodospira magna]SEQ11393.1 Pyruvate phosphate dikinase, PEP/pyruvate binding domain [Ectothiorhodospira magna]
MALHQNNRVSTGLEGLDEVIDGLRIGDNVVWRVDHMEDYRRVIDPFVTAARQRQRAIIYLRFGHDAPLVAPAPDVHVVQLDALWGFEAFTCHVYQLITDHGRGAFYVFDCLSDLLSAWATDLMVGNFFQVVCPYLYELDTVAYFGLLRQRHSHHTVARIQQTTQVLIDVRRTQQECHVQPVKVWKRHSPTLCLPHRWQGDHFTPVIDSSDATRVQTALAQDHAQEPQRHLDYWDALFLNAAESLNRTDDPTRQAAQVERLCRVMLGRDERILNMARRYFTLTDLLAIRARMIGSGHIGGKAVGMLLARQILLKEAPKTWTRHLEPHDSFFLGTDVYYSFLVHNGWWPRIMRQRTAEGYYSEGQALHERMCHGRLPDEIRAELARMLDYFGQYPILVRSSSLLEDGFGNAFAGKYDSVFCVNQGTPEARLEQLEQAVCQVFASAMSEDALVYREQRGLAQLEEPMALLLQRVNGRYHGRHYLPDAAGVGVSRNIFVWDKEMDPAAGMVRLVMGLGTRAVDRNDGDHACIIALDHPLKRPFAHADDGRFLQHQVDTLDVLDNALLSRPLRELIREDMTPILRWCGQQDHSVGETPVWRLNFVPLLDRTPFVPMIQQLLQTLESVYDYPVDVEFTVHLGQDGTPSFNLVQCRPLQTRGASRQVQLPEAPDAERIVFRTQGHFMGGSLDQPIARVIRVEGLRYSALTLQQKYTVARLVGQLNRRMPDRDIQPTVLIGPGRWGTSTPELGVPIRFADISRMAVLVEVAELGGGIIPDLSYGSHFFQDLVESGIAYVALLPQNKHTDYAPHRLNTLAAEHIPPDLVEGLDEAVLEAVTVHDVRALDLRLLADVVSQQVLCYMGRPATGP